MMSIAKKWHDAKVYRGLYGVENIGSNHREERTVIRVSNVLWNETMRIGLTQTRPRRLWR